MRGGQELEDRRTDGQTDRRTDGQTDGRTSGTHYDRAETSKSKPNPALAGLIKTCKLKNYLMTN